MTLVLTYLLKTSFGGISRPNWDSLFFFFLFAEGGGGGGGGMRMKNAYFS